MIIFKNNIVKNDLTQAFYLKKTRECINQNEQAPKKQAV